jgi:hypothetical protein
MPPGGNAIPHSDCGLAAQRYRPGQPRLIQRGRLFRLSGAEPRIPYPLTGMPDQCEHAVPRNAVPRPSLGGGRAVHILSDQVFDHLNSDIYRPFLYRQRLAVASYGHLRLLSSSSLK